MSAWRPAAPLTDTRLLLRTNYGIGVPVGGRVRREMRHQVRPSACICSTNQLLTCLPMERSSVTIDSLHLIASCTSDASDQVTPAMLVGWHAQLSVDVLHWCSLV